MEIYAVVLASGNSTRMGQPKLLLQWEKKTIIEHVLDKLTNCRLSGAKIVIPANNKSLEEKVSSYPYSMIPNKNPELGLGHSLSLAMKSLPPTTEAVIILLGDQPTIASQAIQQNITTYRRIRESLEYCPEIIIQMRYQKARIGHPVLFSKHFFTELKQITGDHGGRDIIKKNKPSIVLCESESSYPNDIDSMEDYQSLLKRERTGSG